MTATDSLAQALTPLLPMLLSSDTESIPTSSTSSLFTGNTTFATSPAVSSNSSTPTSQASPTSTSKLYTTDECIYYVNTSDNQKALYGIMATSLIINFGLLIWWLRLYCYKRAHWGVPPSQAAKKNKESVSMEDINRPLSPQRPRLIDVSSKPHRTDTRSVIQRQQSLRKDHTTESGARSSVGGTDRPSGATIPARSNQYVRYNPERSKVRFADRASFRSNTSESSGL